MAGAVGTAGAAAEVSTSIEDDVAGSPVALAPQRLASGGETAEQMVRLEIRGGSLSIRPSTASVQLARDGDVLRGTIGDATVIDARGTLDGWRARMRVIEVTAVDADGATKRIPPGRVAVTPTFPRAIAGHVDEVRAGRPFRARANGTLLSAGRGGGGGTFLGNAVVEIADAETLTSATVTVRFSVR